MYLASKHDQAYEDSPPRVEMYGGAGRHPPVVLKVLRNVAVEARRSVMYARLGVGSGERAFGASRVIAEQECRGSGARTRWGRRSSWIPPCLEGMRCFTSRNVIGIRHGGRRDLGSVEFGRRQRKHAHTRTPVNIAQSQK